MGKLEARFYQFTERPLSDSCWSLSTGPDGRIYASACCEQTGGEAVTVVRYNETTDSLDYLFDLDKVTGDLRDSGRATQCKIHYSFAPDPDSGILYCATHLSGPPIGETSYCPWGSWHDKKRAFRGSYLVAYDTTADRVAWSHLMIPHEGCRCLCLDLERQWLYAATYPRDHFVIFDIRNRSLRDMGRIGSINTQCIFLDRRKRAFFTNDRGYMMRYDPASDRLEELPIVMPHPYYQTGWHCVIYDAVADPTGECIYIAPWVMDPHLVRYWPEDGPNGHFEDLGRASQERDLSFPIAMWSDHVGGLVFGTDGNLYFVKATWAAGTERSPDFQSRANLRGVVVRLDPRTLQREEVCVLDRMDAPGHYASRAGRDKSGNLYFGNVGRKPVGIFRMTVPGASPRLNAHLPLRMWG